MDKHKARVIFNGSGQHQSLQVIWTLIFIDESLQLQPQRIGKFVLLASSTTCHT